MAHHLKRMRCLALLAGLAALLSTGAISLGDEPAADLRLVLAVTKPTVRPPSTSLFLYDIATSSRAQIHEDATEGRRILVKMGGSDIVGAGRAAREREIYVMMGPATVDSALACSDTLSRVRPAAGEPKWEPIFFVPLCFSDASPYGLWNRAPIFAVDQSEGRVALPALRVGETKLERPSIRVLSATGVEEWQIPLPGRWFHVTDLAWSPDGKQLAYAVLPEGDVHTLDESQLPNAGLYLADIETRTTRLVYHCYVDALAWGPKAGQLSIAARPRDIWDRANVVRVITVPDGKKVEEFSALAAIQALAYTDDGQWLAVQSVVEGGQAIWLYPAAGGWGRQVYNLPAGEGRLSLLGWVRIGEGVSEP